jgi:hypothetical protein
MAMIDVTFQEPADGGHEGFSRRARAPLLEAAKGSRVVRLLMADDSRSVMLVECSTDYHSVIWSKSQMRRFVAELESVVESMHEPNPFHLDSINLIAQQLLLEGSDRDRHLARRLMVEGGYSDELIDMKITSGARRAREIAEHRRRAELEQIKTDAGPIKRFLILAGTVLVSMLIGMMMVYILLR